MNKETEIVNKTRIYLQEKLPGILLWRNSLGYDERAKVYYGIGNPGGSDLIGIYKGKFCALEVKIPGGRIAESQTNFIRVIVDSGGIGGIVHSPEEAEALFK